jgi:alkylhydroperoxidase/carboxymuconolactone decarboxylase family protein YurZ
MNMFALPPPTISVSGHRDRWAGRRVTQYPYCIRGHTELALSKRATEQEVMEAIWVAAEMRAGAAYAHANLAIDTMNHVAAKQAGD